MIEFVVFVIGAVVGAAGYRAYVRRELKRAGNSVANRERVFRRLL